VDDRIKQADAATDDEAFPYVVDDLLCFALYAASRAVTGAYRPLLDDLGLTYPQYLVMVSLWERDRVPVKELAETLQLDYGTLSPLLKRLESAGLLTRQRRADDERSVQVALTENGAALRSQARCVPGAMADLMGLSDREFNQLLKALHRLTTNLTAGDVPSA
jgi:MarR family transcriptional regulator, organic hydroperoxide resistance regulator